MKVSIIILNYQSERLVRYCIENIRKANISIPYEIIIVNNDNASVLSAVHLHTHDLTIVQAKENKGFSAGNNLGIQQAVGEYVLVINPDIVITRGSVETLVEFLDSHPKAALVGPRLRNPDQSLQYSVFQFPKSLRDFFIPIYARTPMGKTREGVSTLRRYLMKDWDHKNTRTVDWFLGAAMLVRKSFIQQHGGFDERYFLYNEDMDLCMRAWITGWEVWYDPNAVMTHYIERILPEQVWYQNVFDKHTWIHSISWIKFFWKWRKEIFRKD